MAKKKKKKKPLGERAKKNIFYYDNVLGTGDTGTTIIYTFKTRPAKRAS